MPLGPNKYGREQKRHYSSMRYTSEKRWVKNRLRRILRHLRKYPNDLQAKRSLEAS